MVSMYLLYSGEVEFTTEIQIEGKRCALKAGNIFGMEDFVYHLPDKRRIALTQKTEFFAEYHIKGWRNRRFTVQTKKYCEIFTLKLRRNIEELQHDYQTVADDLCLHQIESLKELLYFMLTTAIEGPLAPWMNKDIKISEIRAPTKSISIHMKNIGHNTFSRDCSQTVNLKTYSINGENETVALTGKEKELVEQWEKDKQVYD